MVAGLIDSFFLSMAWTVVVLRVSATEGLGAASLLSTAMLVGVALSAPVAGALARALSGRALLRTAGGVEAVLRLTVFGLVVGHGPLWVLAVGVTAMNIVAWTGYAGMRAEVSAENAGAAGLARYGSLVAGTEAAGIAAASLLPIGHQRLLLPLLVGVAACYALALLPTVWIARGSAVPRAPARAAAGAWTRPGRVTQVSWYGALLMLLSAGPTLLVVPLAAHLHGPASVGPAAVAFTIGSLVSPRLAARVQGRGENRPFAWVLCAVGMVVGWALAPVGVGWLLVAQLMSGLCMTTLEGLLDASTSEHSPERVTEMLARATASRALGAAAGTALLPVVIAAAGLCTAVLAVCGLLVVGALLTRRRSTPSERTLRPSQGTPAASRQDLAPSVAAPARVAP